MNFQTDFSWPEGSGWVELPEIIDARGALTFGENSAKHLPFDVQRVFWIYQVPDGAMRGGHAHRTCAELLFAVHGSFCVRVTNGKQSKTVCLNKPNIGLLIPAGMWCELTEFSTQAVCLVLASQTYDPSGYINSFTQYLNERS